MNNEAGKKVIQTELLWWSYDCTKMLGLMKTNEFDGYILKYFSRQESFLRARVYPGP